MKYTEVDGIDTNTYAGKAAHAVKTKTRGILSNTGFETFIFLDFVELLLLNNKFASKGIFITDDNREECYIKIIELGESSLIDDLEKFINLKDSIQELTNKRNEYVSIIDQLKNVDDDSEEKVNQIVEEYLRR